MKRKIITDLDILTVAYWDEKKEANDFLNRIKSNEFELYVPYLLFDLLSKWSHRGLSEKIKHFYELHATKIITLQDSLTKIDELKINDKKIVAELKTHNIKEEDITLVIITAIFDLDYLVTYNKKHLRNMENEIGEVLKKDGLKTISIVLPSEI